MSTSASDEFVLTRTLNAPRAAVFKAWTELDALKKWFGPKGMPIQIATLDLRPGGAFHYNMALPNGGVMWGKWVFSEITPIERLRFTSGFSDAAGNASPNPWMKDWPQEVANTVTFVELTPGKTTMTMRGVPQNASDAERNTWRSMFDSMNNGWGGTMEQLEAFLAS